MKIIPNFNANFIELHTAFCRSDYIEKPFWSLTSGARPFGFVPISSITLSLIWDLCESPEAGILMKYSHKTLYDLQDAESAHRHIGEVALL